MRQLFRFIDWVVALPEELEGQFWQEVYQFEQGKQMPYITSVERIGIQKRREEGLPGGLQKAIALGLKLKFGPEGFDRFRKSAS